MQYLGDRVRIEREEKEWSQRRLAEEVTRRGYKIGQSAIGNIESGKTKKALCIVQLAAALGVAPTWLQTGRGEKAAITISSTSKHAGNLNVNDSNKLHQPDETLSPLVLWKTGRMNGGRQGGFLLSKLKAGEVERPEFLRFSQNAFAYRVQDDINAPAYRTHDTVLVDPDAPTTPGNDCLFTGEAKPDAGTEAVAGQLIRFTATEWIVQQYALGGETKLLKSAFPNAWLIVGRYNRR